MRLNPVKLTYLALVAFFSFALASALPAQDLAGSKDPPGTRRYAGSEIIAYRAPKFDEFELPLSPPAYGRPGFDKSLKLQGLVSRYTYLAPLGRSTLEVMANYKLEFQRLGLIALYEKVPGGYGRFISVFADIAIEDGVRPIFDGDEAHERLLVGKTKDAKPSYYLVFVATANGPGGGMADWLRPKVQRGQTVAEVIVVAPSSLEERMEFVNAAEMSKSLTDSGKIALYGIYFDTDKDTLQSTSTPTLQEIATLLKSDPKLKVWIVGHSDNQGVPAYNLDLSRRRAATVIRELTSKFGIAADRLDSFGCGPYAPVESNDTEQGRARNRRVELVRR
jgi:outer membrane protein OmpA-like peptidoglycan-associated protein